MDYLSGIIRPRYFLPMSRFWIFPFVFLAASFCLFSCSAPKALEYRDYKNLTVQTLSFDSSVVGLDVEYYNPNNYRIKLRHADLDIFVDGNFMGHVTQEYDITIPKKGEFSVPLQLKVDMQNIFKNALISVFSQQADLRASGSIKVGKAFVFFKIPVNYESVQHFKIGQ
jgi:LEA14-like dessication related protein